MKIKLDMQGIDELPSGSYRVRVQYKGERLIDTAPTLPEAIALRDGFRKNGRAKKFVKSNELSINSWGHTWLKECRKDKDYKSELGRLARHILGNDFANKPLKQVTPDDVFLWCKSLEKKLIYDGVENCGERDPEYLSFSTRKHCLDLLRALFKDAKGPLYRYCDFNPAADIRIEKNKEELLKLRVSREWPLREHEVLQHLDSFDDLPERWISQASLGTAMRQGEQWALRTQDVHLGGSQPYIHIREGKTASSVRNIALFGLGLEAFQHWLEILGKYAPRNPDRLVFPTEVQVKANGEPYARGGNQRARGAPRFFKERSVLPGRKDPIWWHLYRHTCATSLLCGVPLYGGEKWTIQEVATLLGHSSTKTTEMYAHFFESALAPVVQRTQEGWQRQQKKTARKNLRLVG